MKAIKYAAMALLVGYCAALAALGLGQRAFQYHPAAAYAAPAAAGLAGVEELRLATPDGENLIAWSAPPRRGRPVIVYFHGNSGVLADRAKRFRLLLDAGYGLVATAWRGYSGSSGSPTQEGLMLDAETAWREAIKRGAAPAHIVLMGESLGTGVATAMAAAHPAAALVLDSPFLSALDVAERRYPIFPVRFLMRDPFRSDLAIPNVHMPVLILHGEGDPIIPIDSARALFSAANEPKSFIAVPVEKHLVLALDDVFPRVRAFIDAAVPQRAAAGE
jgi:uncharacterized protein